MAIIFVRVEHDPLADSFCCIHTTKVLWSPELRGRTHGQMDQIVHDDLSQQSFAFLQSARVKSSTIQYLYLTDTMKRRNSRKINNIDRYR